MPKRILLGRYRGVLEPLDRLAEVMYGLIMALAVTSSLSLADAGRSEVRAMFVGALGCNVAWGIVDAVMYLVGRLSRRGERLKTLRILRKVSEPAEGRRLISDSLPPLIAGVLQPEEWDELQRRLKQLPEPPSYPRLAKEDWLGSIAVFLLVFLATLPVAIPFLLVSDPNVALRTSNAVAVVMLFIIGIELGRYVGYPSLRMGLWMVVLGSLLVGITIALGG